MSLGENIKNYRVSENLTQEQLAEKIGVSRQAVTKWEMNKTAPSTDNLIRLGEIFGDFRPIYFLAVWITLGFYTIVIYLIILVIKSLKKYLRDV